MNSFKSSSQKFMKHYRNGLKKKIGEDGTFGQFLNNFWTIFWTVFGLVAKGYLLPIRAELRKLSYLCTKNIKAKNLDKFSTILQCSIILGYSMAIYLPFIE